MERSKLLDALVIKAVLEGAETPEGIVKRLDRVDPGEVRRAVERLLAEGSLTWKTKKRLLLGEKRVLAVTERGLRKLEEARSLARSIVEAARVEGGETLAPAPVVDPVLLALSLMLLGLPLAWDVGEGYAEGGGYDYMDEDAVDEYGDFGDFDTDLGAT